MKVNKILNKNKIVLRYKNVVLILLQTLVNAV